VTVVVVEALGELLDLADDVLGVGRRVVDERVVASVVGFALVDAQTADALGGVVDLLEVPGDVGSTTASAVVAVLALLALAAVAARMVGVVVVLPASRRERLGVLAGTVLCLAGLALFTQYYPQQWTDGASPMAFPTMVTYFVGGCVAFWFVFTAIAEFHVRNNPTDTVNLELKRQGETKTVQLSRQEYQHYRSAIRGDGGETQQVIQELQSRFEE